jgi:hypothetical protein
LIQETSSKVAEQYALQLYVYLDEVKSAFELNPIYKAAALVIENNIRLPAH